MEDLHGLIPDRDSYDRALAAGVKRTEDLLLANESIVQGVRGVPERLAHLAPVADVWRRVELAAAGLGPPVFALVSAPPQTGKTSLAETSLARMIARRPETNVGWLSYGATLSREKSRNIRDYATRLGVSIRRDSRAVERWQTVEGGGLLAKGLDGPISGFSSMVVIVIDDPYASKAKALSPTHRAWIRSQIQGSVFSRFSPTTSIVIQHTRWAVDDLIGWAHELWGDLFGEPIRIPAVEYAEDRDGNFVVGEPIVTFGGRDRAYYERQHRISESEWWPLYMGLPRPSAGALFQQHGVILTDDRPSAGHTTIGLDFAYTERKRADWSVALVYRRIDHRACILDVLRRQVSAPRFADEVAKLSERYAGAPLHAYVGGQERGIADFWAARGIRGLTIHPTGVDKVTRAQGAAAAWNDGNIMIPSSTTWGDDLVQELLNFGAGGHDDQVDALVSAHDFNPYVSRGLAGLGLAQPKRQSAYAGSAGSSRENLLERLRKSAEGPGGGPRSPITGERIGGPAPAWRPGAGRLPTKHGW